MSSDDGWFKRQTARLGRKRDQSNGPGYPPEEIKLVDDEETARETAGHEGPSVPRRSKQRKSRKPFRRLVQFFSRHIKRFGRAVGNRTKFGQLRSSPISGLRLRIYHLTGGRWNFGQSPKQRRDKCTTVVSRWSRRVALVVVSFGSGGGIGKTTTASTLAQEFQATCEGKPVLLIDKHPQGTVGNVTGVKFGDIQAVIDEKPEEACFTLLQAHQHMSKLNSFAEIQWRFAVMPKTGLYVLTYPERARLTRENILTLIEVLKQYFSVIVIDSDQDFGHADTHAVLEVADVIAVIMKHHDEKRIVQASDTLNTLHTEERYEHVRNRVVLVVNMVMVNFLHRGTSKSVKMLSEIQEEKNYVPHKGAITTLPWNLWIARGRLFRVRDRSSKFRLHALELTATVIETAGESPKAETQLPFRQTA